VSRERWGPANVWRLALILAVLAAACSPALNWREVHLDRMIALLPCKPDHAQRVVQLGTQGYPMEMVGCEAAGGLFAISHVTLARPDQVSSVLAAWRAGTLEKMQATAVMELPIADAPAAGTRPSILLQATGRRVDGSTVQSRLAWLVAGVDIFQIAVYAPQLGPDMTDPLFSELRLQ
jgi:hypothetical protein